MLNELVAVADHAYNASHIAQQVLLLLLLLLLLVKQISFSDCLFSLGITRLESS